MNSKATQKNLGIGNKNEVYNKIIINIGGNDYETDLVTILKHVTSSFESEDKKINENLPNQILINKTNRTESYQTFKIISSLLILGIPFGATFAIAQLTISKIWGFINNSKETLTTKELRKMVCKSIQEIDINELSCTYSDIETWTNKYVRRYGHNNKIIEIYRPDLDSVIPISYEYICKDFIDDILSDMEIEDEISLRYRKEIATEILSFINGCDLYRVNYHILKLMIAEIATQPPHPWFINKNTQKKMLIYDRDALIHNIEKVNTCNLKDNLVPQSVKIEILHHASSLILQSYNYFLGCYDLSSFYLLKDIVEKLENQDYWDLNVTNLKISRLLSDMVFSGIDSNGFIMLMNEISRYMNNRHVGRRDFNELVLKFGNYALQITQRGSVDEIQKFVDSNWEQYSQNEIVTYIKMVLYSIYPSKRFNLEYLNNFFWISYTSFKLESVDNIKNQMLVIYSPNDISNLSIFDLLNLDLLNRAKVQHLCNLIIIVSETENICNCVLRDVEICLVENKLSSHYSVIYLDKKRIESLVYSSNKMQCFDNIIAEQIVEPMLN